MSNFVGTSPFLNSIIGCHGNHAFSHSPDRFIFRILHLGGLNEQFGTQEKSPWGGGGGQVSLIGQAYIVL